jgi:hypothetical protein
MNISRTLVGRWLVLSLALILFNFSTQPIFIAFASDNSVMVLADGTELTVETLELITSKTAVEGDPLTFKVKEDVIVGGKVLIAKGAIAKGVVSNAKRSGRMGKGGELSIRVESTVTVDGQKVRLRSTKGGEGDSATGATVALVVLFGPLGLLKKGKNAVMKPGTAIKAYTDEEVKVSVSTP